MCLRTLSGPLNGDIGSQTVMPSAAIAGTLGSRPASLACEVFLGLGSGDSDEELLVPVGKRASSSSSFEENCPVTLSFHDACVGVLPVGLCAG